MSSHCRLLILVLTCQHFFGCVGPIKHQMTTDYPAAVLRVVGTPAAVDGRARFREIFCQLLAEKNESAAHGGRCDDYLLRLTDEPHPAGIATPPPDLNPCYRVLIVPDLLNDCFSSITFAFADAILALRDRGVKIDSLVVGGRSSSDINAAYLAETIKGQDLARDERLILIGHSKGVVDILHCLVNYPEAARRVAAVISVAGAVNGCLLTPRLNTIYADLARRFTSGPCHGEDDGAIESLNPAVRLSWLAAHPLPESVAYFSLAAMTTRDRMNTLLKASYDLLWIYSPRNDGVLLISDQLIPGGTLLGYANVDHWSVVLPLEDQHRRLSETIRSPVKFPRDVLLEALLVYVTEALEAKGEQF